MASITILGATGSLGAHVARQALATGHDLTVFVRNPARLAPEIAARARIAAGDLLLSPLDAIADCVAGRDALLACAGLVTGGQRFVDLVDRVVTAIESLPIGRQPRVAWFLAGAGLLALDDKGRRGVDLPKVRDTYWPHARNFERLQRSAIAWRLLCPGPMVQGEPIGLDRLRVTTEVLPSPLPGWATRLPAPLVLPVFAAHIPEMIVPYADAAAYMLAHLAPDAGLDRRRVGLALPSGMKGRKDHWAARPPQAA